MLIAHLPAGWLLARRIAPLLARDRRESGRLLVAGVAAAMLPDIDLLYFYLADGQRTLHHDYWTHIPIFWPVLLLALAALLLLARAAVPWRVFAVLLAGVALHLVLDTVTGGIAWLYPWSAERMALVQVPARFGWWVWNFVLHWSFMFEIAVVLWAGREAGLTKALRRGAPARILVSEDRERERYE